MTVKKKCIKLWDREIGINNGILEITYSYNVLETMGEAVAVYDLNTGIVLEHQDWQNDIIQLLQEDLQKYKK